MIVTTYILQVLTTLVALLALAAGIAAIMIDGNIAKALYQFVLVAVNVGLFFAQAAVRKAWREW